MDGNKIRILREIRGLSQWELSTATGIDRGRISLIENGHVTATPLQEEEIKLALEWTPEVEKSFWKTSVLWTI